MSEARDSDNIAKFLTTCIDRGGGVWERGNDNLIEAILPTEISTLLEAEPMLSLALTPDVLEGEPGAQLATPGSPAMDAFIRFASTFGRTTLGVILPTYYRGKGLRDEVSRQVTYRNCRIRSDDSPPVIKDSCYAVYYFRVEYVSDERREQIVVIAVDLRTMRPNRDIVDRLRTLTADNDSTISPDWYSGDRLDRAFAVAQVELDAHVRQRADLMLGSARKRFDVESQRLSEYYMQVGWELNRRVRAESDESKRAGLNDKIAVSKADGERKINELSEKYRIRCRASLTSVMLLRQPKTYFDLLIDRGSLTKRVTFVYDSLLDRLELPLCDKCANEMNSVSVSAKGFHLCPGCTG